jgi:hypothetical protein
VELMIEDDLGARDELGRGLRGLARRCDVLLGPYSTYLSRTAGEVAPELDVLLWNHGGAGDDVQAMAPGHVASVLTPTRRYAETFVQRLADLPARALLWVLTGRGSFSRQVAEGAEAMALRHGLRVRRRTYAEGVPEDVQPPWDAVCAGSFEEDVALMTRLRAMRSPPRSIWAVAAGVDRFLSAVTDPAGVYGVAQWVPGAGGRPEIGPPERDFQVAYRRLTGGWPEYPAAQAAAAAALAAHCVEVAGTTGASNVWSAASALDCRTFFGRFRMDPRTGAQEGHDVVLVRWTGDGRLTALG